MPTASSGNKTTDIEATKSDVTTYTKGRHFGKILTVFLKVFIISHYLRKILPLIPSNINMLGRFTREPTVFPHHTVVIRILPVMCEGIHVTEACIMA